MFCCLLRDCFCWLLLFLCSHSYNCCNALRPEAIKSKHNTHTNTHTHLPEEGTGELGGSSEAARKLICYFQGIFIISASFVEVLFVVFTMRNMVKSKQDVRGRLKKKREIIITGSGDIEAIF